MLLKGKVVTALLFGGSRAKRRVVADKGETVVVCAEEEYQLALREGREPSGIGFPRVDIVDAGDTKPMRKGPSAEDHRDEPKSRAGD